MNISEAPAIFPDCTKALSTESILAFAVVVIILLWIITFSGALPLGSSLQEQTINKARSGSRTFFMNSTLMVKQLKV